AGTASLLVARLHLFGNVGDHSEEEDEPATAARKRSRKKYGLLTRSTGDSDDLEAEEPVEPRETRAPVSGPVTTKLNSLDRAVAGGRKRLSDRYTVEPQTMWSLYYLYALERLTALAGLSEIAGHDWYTEGATQLLKIQSPQGTWNDNCGAVPATSFG